MSVFWEQKKFNHRYEKYWAPFEIKEKLSNIIWKYWAYFENKEKLPNNIWEILIGFWD